MPLLPLHLEADAGWHRALWQSGLDEKEKRIRSGIQMRFGWKVFYNKLILSSLIGMLLLLGAVVLLRKPVFC